MPRIATEMYNQAHAFSSATRSLLVVSAPVSVSGSDGDRGGLVGFFSLSTLE
jgi:hypothetical protein